MNRRIENKKNDSEIKKLEQDQIKNVYKIRYILLCFLSGIDVFLYNYQLITKNNFHHFKFPKKIAFKNYFKSTKVYFI